MNFEQLPCRGLEVLGIWAKDLYPSMVLNPFSDLHPQACPNPSYPCITWSLYHLMRWHLSKCPFTPPLQTQPTVQFSQWCGPESNQEFSRLSPPLLRPTPLIALLPAPPLPPPECFNGASLPTADAVSRWRLQV